MASFEIHGGKPLKGEAIQRTVRRPSGKKQWK